jgi:hypothetical protein
LRASASTREHQAVLRLVTRLNGWLGSFGDAHARDGGEDVAVPGGALGFQSLEVRMREDRRLHLRLARVFRRAGQRGDELVQHLGALQERARVARRRE